MATSNYRFWAGENPHVAVESGLHSLRTTAWVAISKTKIIGPFNFHETVNKENYIKMIFEQYITALEIAGLEENQTWFQQVPIQQKKLALRDFSVKS